MSSPYGNEAGAPQQWQASTPPTPPNRWLLPTLTGIGGFALGIAGGLAVFTMQQSARDEAVAVAEASASASAEAAAAADVAAAQAILPDALDSCGLTDAVGFTLGDSGRSLTFDMRGEDDRTGADIVEIACVLGALGTPQGTISHMDQTTSLDGRQTAEWDSLEVSWSYHPGRGMDGVIRVVDRG
ncbi:MAG: hypothetical protein Q4G64_02460 [bacterium]|nr:hypothetical protein [bacterium]